MTSSGMQQSLPFQLGETIDAMDADGVLIERDYLGKKFVIKAKKGSTTPYTPDSEEGNLYLTAVVCRNTSGGALLGSRFGALSGTAGVEGLYEVSGYGATLLQDGVVAIDDGQ